MDINPFKPGSPVPPGIFAGRVKEIERIYRITIDFHLILPLDFLRLNGKT
jgi:hypothetical protein